MRMNVFELADSIGIPLESIFFEGGLVLRKEGGNWLTHNNTASGPLIVDPKVLHGRLKPVLIRCKSEGSIQPIDFILKPVGGFAPRLNTPIVSASAFFDIAHIQYISEAIVYHVAGMLRAYENIRDSFKNGTLIPGFPKTNICNYQGQPEPYYEFDALLGTVRRGYNSCRYPLWKFFGPSKGSIPRSFEKTLSHCSRLNPSLLRKFQNSWDNFGSVTTNYRDCIHHYVPLDFGLSTITMSEIFPGIWTAFARIPDNPEAKSTTKFTFKKNLDALTFGWQLAVESLSVMSAVVASTRAEEESGLTTG